MESRREDCVGARQSSRVTICTHVADVQAISLSSPGMALRCHRVDEVQAFRNPAFLSLFRLTYPCSQRTVAHILPNGQGVEEGRSLKDKAIVLRTRVICCSDRPTICLPSIMTLPVSGCHSP